MVSSVLILLILIGFSDETEESRARPAREPDEPKLILIGSSDVTEDCLPGTIIREPDETLQNVTEFCVNPST